MGDNTHQVILVQLNYDYTRVDLSEKTGNTANFTGFRINLGTDQTESRYRWAIFACCRFLVILFLDIAICEPVGVYFLSKLVDNIGYKFRTLNSENIRYLPFVVSRRILEACLIFN